MSFGMVGFALPLYAVRLGLNLTEVGLLASINLAAALLFKPVMGRLADHYGLKRALVAALGLRSLVALLLMFAGTAWQLYAIRSMLGLSQALRDPPVNALVAETGGTKAVASAFAWYATAKSVAGSIGAAVAGVVLSISGSSFSLVFGLGFVLSVLPVYAVVRWVTEGIRPEPVAERAIADDHVAADATPPTPRIAAFVGLGFMVSGTAQMLRGLLPVLAIEYGGLSEAQAGLVYLVSAVAVLGAGPVFGWVSDTVSQRLVFMVRSVANTVSSIIFLIAPHAAGFAIAKTIDDLGKAAFRPAWGALMADAARLDPARRARTMGLMGMGEDAGELAGPVVAGFIWTTWGIPAVLGARVVLALGTEVYAALATRSLGGGTARVDNAVGTPDAPPDLDL